MVKIATMGDNVVDCYLAQNQMFPGGNCLNVAVFISRFGGNASYIGAVGRDAAGHAILEALNHERVNTQHLRQLDGTTGYCVIGHRKADRVFVTYDLGVSMFEPSESDFAFLPNFDAVQIGQSSGLDHHLARVASITRLSYDFSDKYSANKIARIAPHCFLSSASAREDSYEHARELVQSVLHAGAKWCLVTRGAQGAMLGQAGAIYEVPAAPASLVDTLGAGDTFIARTLFGLVTGEAPEVVLKAAAEEAAKTCNYYGAVGHGVPIELAVDVGAIKTAYPDILG